MNKIIKYRFINPKDENFVRDLEIEENKTFYDLHLAIQKACKYDPSLLTTFYLSNERWEKVKEISVECIDPESQKDVLLMKETPLNKFNPVIGQKYVYIFDFFSVRLMLIEIVNIRKKTADDLKLEFPICTLSKGNPPSQIFIDDIDNIDSDIEMNDDLFDDIFNDNDFDNFDDDDDDYI